MSNEAVTGRMTESTAEAIGDHGELNRRARSSRGLSWVLLGCIGAVTLGPVICLIALSFNVAPFGDPYTFGLEAWRDAFSDAATLNSIANSFILTLRVPIALALAFVISWLLVRADIPGRNFIEMSFWFGFFLPTVPLMMGWILLLDEHYGLINLALMQLPFVAGPVFTIHSLTGILWVHITATTIPVLVIILTPSLRQFDFSLEEACEISGGGWADTFRRVTLPLLAPALITAFIAAFVKNLEAFEVEQILGVPAGIHIYATKVFEFVNWDPPRISQAMALSTAFLLILIALAAFNQLYLRSAGNVPTIAGRGVRVTRRVRRRWCYAASAILIAFVCLTVMLPLAVLILGSFTKLFGFFFLKDAFTVSHWAAVLGDGRFTDAAVSSVLLALAVGALGIILFALIAWCLVRADIWGKEILGLMIWLPWAIPGLVIGATFLTLFLETPLLSSLYGTIVPLILVLLIKELPIGVHMMRTAITQTSSELEEAGVVSGAGFLTVFRRITLPLVAPALVSVFLLLFAATMRDISTIVLLAAPGMRTLSLLMFDFANSGRFEEATVLSVMVALISLLVTAMAFQLAMRAGIRRD